MPRDELPESAYKHQLLGLNLLFLLSQNRVAEFHTELERLPARDIQTNVYIKHPVSLEQVRVVGVAGVYNKVFLAKGNIPAESYTFFIDILLDTIRSRRAMKKIILRPELSGTLLTEVIGADSVNNDSKRVRLEGLDQRKLLLERDCGYEKGKVCNDLPLEAEMVFAPPSNLDPRGWLLGPDNYYSFISQQQKPEEVTIPSTELAKQVIEYARHLEMIV
ncbi:hypothetical protein chiPu_0021615 [Chiloscyllium punctatum]|uniref:CSN8/PSMD8/EIF3K domain-containing protein n=1 Tax=Chiloscyllium punctatum TaxID=137246 RepID=A0A401RIS7_CHIPU|nr:hypothetical protein [Chiloscyllium punctatum]